MNYVEKKSSLSTRDFFCIIIRTTTHQIASMQYVLIIHEVESYPAWKTIFDQAAGIRKSAGEISYQLLRYDEDANNIVHFSQWSCLEKARRFFESAELLEIRKRAGVKAPNFIYLHELERCTL
ncbi:antibiotic biosynthesis monooxygenase [Methylomonas koyamae]|uniref:antibiotic biosynthesis monooxygenase n=1 Tax=Methylomonas koyamae TaxID=702114 RepID=UPI0021B1E2AB|nr:antibiotic biosynthesis monooxygenase [Methylomonas koyamae]